MLWSKLYIPTLREDHPLLIKAGYKRKHDYLFLGQRVMSKMMTRVRAELTAAGGQEFHASSMAAMVRYWSPRQVPQLWFQFRDFQLEIAQFLPNASTRICQRLLQGLY